MISTLPSVQFSCKKARRYICYSAKSKRDDKRIANRRHRRAFNRITQRLTHDPETFWDEGFNVPTLSDWEIF